MNNRYASCLAFAQMSAARTGCKVSVLSLPNGSFRAMFTTVAQHYGFHEFITTTINGDNGERQHQ